MKKESIIGIDVGCGYCKVVTENKSDQFRSNADPKSDISSTLGDKPKVLGETVTVCGQTYDVGTKAAYFGNSGFSLKTIDWVSSPIYAALLASSLVRVVGACDLSSPISVVSGLPVDDMLSKTLVERQIRSVTNSLNLNLIEAKIIPQPFGSLYDYVLSMSGDSIISSKVGLLGVIDIGMYKTNYILVQNLENNVARAAGSIAAGVFTVVDNTRRALMHSFGINYISYDEAEECVCRTKSIKIAKRTVDVSAAINTQIKNTAQSIISAVRASWDREGELDTVLLSGGGGNLLHEYLANISNDTKLISGPEIANARGFYKYGLFRLNHCETR